MTRRPRRFREIPAAPPTVPEKPIAGSPSTPGLDRLKAMQTGYQKPFDPYNGKTEEATGDLLAKRQALFAAMEKAGANGLSEDMRQQARALRITDSGFNQAAQRIKNNAVATSPLIPKTDPTAPVSPPIGPAPVGLGNKPAYVRPGTVPAPVTSPPIATTPAPGAPAVGAVKPAPVAMPTGPSMIDGMPAKDAIARATAANQPGGKPYTTPMLDQQAAAGKQAVAAVTAPPVAVNLPTPVSLPTATAATPTERQPSWKTPPAFATAQQPVTPVTTQPTQLPSSPAFNKLPALSNGSLTAENLPRPTFSTPKPAQPVSPPTAPTAPQKSGQPMSEQQRKLEREQGVAQIKSQIVAPLKDAASAVASNVSATAQAIANPTAPPSTNEEMQKRKRAYARF